ncbi:MAG: hypothetical protein M1823_005131 [Watsoniomyces obsoletus]|nr:MAG: hypothetical protein M1823_005131 [Watsoniomyces obsoletus]
MSCENHQLKLLPIREGLFSLVASNPNAPFHQAPIHACGRHFIIGGSGPCTFCPQAPRIICPKSNLTILGRGFMSVLVPGGQGHYVEPNGAFGFTQAHSAAKPPGSILGGTTPYQGGIFTAPSGSGWFACPLADKPGQYQMFAGLPNVTLDKGCIGFDAYVKDVPPRTLGAWQYT